MRLWPELSRCNIQRRDAAGFTTEGFAPTYKVFALREQTSFAAAPNRFAFNGALGTNLPLDVICPAWPAWAGL